ncbi:MAG TPA: hypothetical protein VHG28_03535 [Longimicrobiaceae bacterium]|nr:hypothetical protein [Longimicrobiaceae bacterium]
MSESLSSEWRVRLRHPLVVGAVLLTGTSPGAAQEHAGHARPDAPALLWSVGAQAVPLLTRADPAFDGEARTEAYLTQPALMGHLSLFGGRVTLLGTLNLEGATLRRGELNAGIWGEGYVDRRHPHTYLHELVGVLRPWGGRGPVDASLAFGKGFVPFGSDDPMTRPFVKFPANHHLAQLLERGVAVAAVRGGPLVVEGALFNGDEPTAPEDLVRWERFGDSWAVRGTLLPLRGVEASASYAAVESPEHPRGGVLDQRKRSAALRWERGRGRTAREYALVEWARTDEYDGEERAFSFPTVLAEAAVRRRGVEVAVRWERTERPEGERLLDPFRAPVPHHDISILGITRWRILTLGASAGVSPHPALRLRPFVEAQRLHARETQSTAFFFPRDFYGAERMWSLSAGVRIEAGSVHPRMGRYGAALPPRAGAITDPAL